MNSFRYHTKTLLGPWRSTAEAAIQDAVRAKQARRDDDGEGWHWVVPGAIEERAEAVHSASRNDNFDFSPQTRYGA
jgi:hypothetical protein